ncbi:hypothetical protein G4B88_018763 [Cannabis sativa]|uniref:Threonylcarbamoyladenosine tRNA methylthiotransferase n=1 Tax=Cannabis sativa TaxID=3483 RepID=A0A7J6I023_CANSA|nr:hypothetical protein G4B88_018763 [Cannabis sativa]
MEDIEDLLVGSISGAPPGFRLPLTSVGLNPKKEKKKPPLNYANTNGFAPKIPGTQTIYIKTFGCSHNQSDSEYMAGQLSAFGYSLSENPDEADLWLINTCTVKSPSQSAMDTIITKGRSSKKPLVVAGCVPQGSRDLKELEGVSVVGVQQIDRVVEVVEETLKGHEVRLLNRKTLPALDLPKVRKNSFVEILPINVGCLGACTYCKTKHARGHLGSYTVDSLVGRVKSVVDDGVKEIWLSSEDTGAYGRDIGVNLPVLLKAIVAELPSDASTMLRIGMTNPPFILEHLKEIADVLCHPCVYSFLHVPVQSGSDAVLSAMNREYTSSEFRTVVDTLTELVPGMHIATDIICGFPGETDEDFAETVSLINQYKFPQVHISQFYPRPGTPAAKMKKVPSTVVKKRSRELTTLFESFTPYSGMEGRVERIWITDIATDRVHLVGHTKGYIQVLVVAPQSMLGTSAIVKITSVGRWSVFGEVIETIKGRSSKTSSNMGTLSIDEKCSPCSNACGDGCESRVQEEACDCEAGGCCTGTTIKHSKQMESEITTEFDNKQEQAEQSIASWNAMDKVLLGGMLEMSRFQGPSSLKRKQQESSSPLDSLSEQERTVYNVIKSKQDMGIWSRDLKRETNLLDNIVNKCMKILLAKKLIKEVVTKNKGKKHFMAAEFEPSKEITGGNWYVDGSLDTEFINLLKDQCFKWIYKMRVATSEGLSDAIRRSGIFKVEFTSQQIEEIVRALVLDNKIEEVNSNGMGEFDYIPVGKVCYKCISSEGKGEPKLGAMASIPCGVCTRISECAPDGVISPKTCIYYEKWLDF